MLTFVVAEVDAVEGVGARPSDHAMSLGYCAPFGINSAHPPYRRVGTNQRPIHG